LLTLLAVLAMQAAAPPSPPSLPPMVQTRSLHADAVAKAHRVGTALADAYDGEVERWAQNADRLREQLVAFSPDDWSESVLAKAQRMIENIEAIAEHRAVLLARLRKQSARDVKAMFEVDAAAGAVAREVADRLVRADERAIETYLSIADFLRAHRADMTKDRGPSRSFDDPSAMAEFLRASLG
jgi:hypothetical protein